MSKQLDEMAHRAVNVFRARTKNITSVDTRRIGWFTSAEELIQSFGYHTLGSGKYGLVFAKTGSPYVVKLMMKDAPYFKWLSFCKDNQNNPYVPKIKGKLIRISDMFFAIRLEKLDPLGHSSDWLIRASNNPVEALHATNDERLQDTNLRKILMFFARNQRLLDVHTGNIMMRGSQFVIVDPFYNWFKDGSFTIDPDDLSDLGNLL